MRNFEKRLRALCYKFRTNEGNGYQDAYIRVSYGRDENWKVNKAVLWADLEQDNGFRCELNAEIPLNELPARWAKRVVRDLEEHWYVYYTTE